MRAVSIVDGTSAWASLVWVHSVVKVSRRTEVFHTHDLVDVSWSRRLRVRLVRRAVGVGHRRVGPRRAGWLVGGRVARGRGGVGAHGLGGGGEGLHRLHHGLRCHDRCPSLGERHGERHLHDPVGDGHDRPSCVVHDGGHLCHCGRDVHLHAVL